MQQLEPSALGRYQIQRYLTRGGMADIYLANDSETNQIVAVKLVHTSSSDYCERFRREVRALAILSHRHILPVLDCGENESWCYLVTPYIEYGTLSDRIKQGPLSFEEADQILLQLTQALQYAHDQGIIHRDIKPSNVLMRDGTHVLLADFGLAKRVGEYNGLTLSGYLIGTPEYMAPELAEEDATQCSDIYALGILLYQMLTGRVPFKANTPIGVYLCHIRDTPELPSTLNPAIPHQIEDVIMHALEKKPDQRFQTAHELYQAYHYAWLQVQGKTREILHTPSLTLLSLQRPRVTIVRQKHRVFRGRMLLLTLPFLLALAPLLLGSVALPSIWRADVIGIHSVGHRRQIVQLSKHHSFSVLSHVSMAMHVHRTAPAIIWSVSSQNATDQSTASLAQGSQHTQSAGGAHLSTRKVHVVAYPTHITHSAYGHGVPRHHGGK